MDDESHLTEACKGETDIEIAAALRRARRVSSKDKALLIRTATIQYGWSQTKIAKMLGVTQARVSQLVSSLPAEKGIYYGTGRPRKDDSTQAAGGHKVLVLVRTWREKLTNPEIGKWIVDEHNPRHAKEIEAALMLVSEAAAVIARDVEDASAAG